MRPDQKYSVQEIAHELNQAGYSPVGQTHPSQIGTYALTESSIHIQPGPQSYHAPDGATVYTTKGKVTAIKADDGEQLSAYELEPQLITGLSDKDRGKRRLVTYDELPKYLVPAVTSIEDRRYFEHGAVDYTRVFGACFCRSAVAAIQRRQFHADHAGGALFFLSPEKQLEAKNYPDRDRLPAGEPLHQDSKSSPFMPMRSRWASVAASRSMDSAKRRRPTFGKNIRDLKLPECALLAGIIQGPSRLSPYKHPKRAIARRNIVLDAMVETHSITPTASAAGQGSTSEPDAVQRR